MANDKCNLCEEQDWGKKKIISASVFMLMWGILCCGYLMMIDLISNEVLGHH